MSARKMSSPRSFNMKAKDVLRSQKTAIHRILSTDHILILNKVHEKELITHREYMNLKSINNANVETHVVELVDKILNKGEERCKEFLDLLQTDEEIKETFPELKDLQLNYTFHLSEPVQASSSQQGDGSSQREVRSYSRKTAQRNRPDVINNETLMAISENLDSSEAAALCFLCCDIVGKKHLEEIKDATGLFLRLKENGLLGTITFLKQLLHTIHREDLVKLLQTNRRQLEEMDARFSLSKYRLMLYKIYHNVTTDSFKRMKIQLRSKLSKRELDQCKTALDVFAQMEKKGLISDTDVDELYNVLQHLDATLAAIVLNYKQGGEDAV